MRDAATSPALDPPAVALPAVAASAHTDEAWSEPAVTLPRDHPAWQRDVLSVSHRVRTIIATLRPLAVRVLTFWDHAIRAVTIAGRRIEIDPSGSYRLR